MAQIECANIKVGQDGEINDQRVCDGNVLKKLYDDVAPKVTMVNGTRDSGTGFFVGNGDKVITNAHIATSDSLTISTFDGKTYPAYVEKYDDTNDLSLLKIVGIEPDAKRAVPLAKNDEIKGTIYSLGHPALGEMTISPGTMVGIGTQYKAMEMKMGSERVQAMIDRAEKRMGAAQTSDLKAQLNAPELWLDQYDKPGSSGSPQLNEKGELVAVLHSGYDLPKGRMTGNIPLNAVRDLLSEKPSKFTFNYEWEQYRISTDAGRQMAVSLELKDVIRHNVPSYDKYRKPFFFDVIPDVGKMQAEYEKQMREAKK